MAFGVLGEERVATHGQFLCVRGECSGLGGCSWYGIVQYSTVACRFFGGGWYRMDVWMVFVSGVFVREREDIKRWGWV